MIHKLSILFLLFILVFHVSCESLYAQIPEDIRKTALRLGKVLSPKPYAKPPQWANPDSPPLFSFAWLSDMHLDGGNQKRMEETFQWIDQQLKPTFLLLTGDNSAIVPSGAEGNDPAVRNFRRQQYLQNWLAEHWKGPYAIIPGDNWPAGFDRVFGPRQYRVQCGGLHLVMLAPDAIHHGPGMEGLSAFDPETFDWLRKDLQQYREHPTLVAIHEPIYPPTFLDAPSLRKLVKDFPQVIGVFQGHLHIDMELRDGKQTYLVAPAVGPGQPPAFKQVLVYRHSLILRTAELDPQANQWRLVEKWQKIDVPEPLQKSLQPVSPSAKVAPNGESSASRSTEATRWPGRETPLQMVSYRPPRPVRDDPALARRAGQLLEMARQFLWKETPRLLAPTPGR